jgi:hypothetical protein
MIKLLDNIRIREIAESRSIAHQAQDNVVPARAVALTGGRRTAVDRA